MRESGAIEQDADMVIFIYRPEYYGLTEEDGESTKGKSIISIAKHRNGKLADVTLKFVGQYARFEDIVEFNNEPSGNFAPNNNFNPNNNFSPSSNFTPNSNFAPNNGFDQFQTRVVQSKINDDFAGA